jgi:hypothetical protein
MVLSERDRIDVDDLINLHDDRADTGEPARADEPFTPDATDDLEGFDRGSWHGTAAR